MLFDRAKVQAIYSDASPAVVEVNVDRWVDDAFVQVAFRSGFLIDDEGHITTNYHVVKDGDRIRVGFLYGPNVGSNRAWIQSHSRSGLAEGNAADSAGY